VINRSSAGLAPHRPDPRAARDRHLAGDLEAVAAIQGEVPLAGGLQVGRHPLGVHAGEPLGEQGRAQPSSLRRLVGAQDEQLPVGPIVGVPRRHALQPTQDRGGPPAKEPDRAGSSRSRWGRDSCHRPGGGSQTAAAAPSAVIQTWSWGKASLRRRNSMKARRTARRRCWSGKLQAMTGSSWKAEASAWASRGHRPGWLCEPPTQSPWPAFLAGTNRTLWELS
jgi:hypothetical protein